MNSLLLGCSICNGETRVIGCLPKTKQFDHLIIRQCMSCGHVSLPKCESQMTEIADEILVRDGSSLSATWVLEKVPEIDVHIKGLRILDIGCWTGELMEDLPESWIKSGVEINSIAAKKAREKGLQVFEEKIELLQDQNESYDLILMMDVLEHLSDPLEDMKSIERLLVPGGLFVALTGNVESLASKVFKGCWYYYNYPDHVTFFSKKSFNIVFQKAGMVPIRVIRVAHHSASLQGTLSKIWERVTTRKGAGEAGLADLISPGDKIVTMLSRVMRGRDHLFVVAKKPN